VAHCTQNQRKRCGCKYLQSCMSSELKRCITQMGASHPSTALRTGFLAVLGEVGLESDFASSGGLISRYCQQYRLRLGP
jgi:hypothetical protein